MSAFNLTRFNRAAGGYERFFERTADGVFDALAGGRVFVEFSRAPAIDVQSSAPLRVALFFSRVNNTEISSAITFHLALLFAQNAAATMTGAGDVGKQAALDSLADTALLSTVEAGKRVPLAGGAAGTLAAAAVVGKTIPFAVAVDAALNAETAASRVSFVEASLSVLLAPGEELRIDSGLFTVTVGGENALSAYNGGWVRLGGNTRRIQVESDAGVLSGGLLYEELYL